MPVGNAGNITAYWRGLHRVPPDGAHEPPPADAGLPGGRRGADRRRRRRSTTRRRSLRRSASATRRPGRRRSRRATSRGGSIDSVTDDEILAAYGCLAREEGIFCEPASAACVAGHAEDAAAGQASPAQTVVCIITGNGLKDPETALRAEPAIHNVPANSTLSSARWAGRRSRIRCSPPDHRTSYTSPGANREPARSRPETLRSRERWEAAYSSPAVGYAQRQADIVAEPSHTRARSYQ